MRGLFKYNEKCYLGKKLKIPDLYLRNVKQKHLHLALFLLTKLNKSTIKREIRIIRICLHIQWFLSHKRPHERNIHRSRI